MNAGKAVVSLILWVGISMGAGLIGSLSTAAAVPTWYADLRKPNWTPPSWIFGPVWTTLYVMMGVAAWLVWRKSGFVGAKAAMWLFFLQLLCNAAWSLIFFGLRSPGLAFAEILLLWGLILATALAFWRHSPIAGALLLPYLAWVTFATALNLAIWRLNLSGY